MPSPSVDNFPPEFLEFFRRSRTAHVSVPSDPNDWLPRGKAIHLRQKLYALRKALREEQHRMSKIAAGVTISLVNGPPGLARVIGGPAYDDLAAAIRTSIGDPTGEPTPAAEASFETQTQTQQDSTGVAGAGDDLPADIDAAIRLYLEK